MHIHDWLQQSEARYNYLKTIRTSKNMLVSRKPSSESSNPDSFRKDMLQQFGQYLKPLIFPDASG